MEDTRRTGITESTKQCSHGITESETESSGPLWVYTQSFTYMEWLLAWCFHGTSNGSGCFYLLLRLFFRFGCLARSWYGGFALSYCSLFCCVSVLSIEGLLLSERKGVSRSGGEEKCRGAGRGERRGNYAWDILYERIIHFRLKQCVFLKHI